MLAHTVAAPLSWVFWKMGSYLLTIPTRRATASFVDWARFFSKLLLLLPGVSHQRVLLLTLIASHGRSASVLNEKANMSWEHIESESNASYEPYDLDDTIQ